MQLLLDYGSENTHSAVSGSKSDLLVSVRNSPQEFVPRWLPSISSFLHDFHASLWVDDIFSITHSQMPPETHFGTSLSLIISHMV